MGDGVEKPSLEKKYSHLENVIFLNPVRKNSIPNLLQKMDVLCFGTNKSKLYKYGISMNKMMDYMMASKPIIQYIDTEYDIIKMAKAEFTVEAQNQTKLSESIINMANLSENERIEMGKSAKSFVLQNHNYEKLASDFIKIVNPA